MALDLAWELAEAGRSKSNVDIESAFELGKKSRDAFTAQLWKRFH